MSTELGASAESLGDEDEQPRRRRMPARGKKVTQVTKKEFLEGPEDDEDADDEIEMPGLFDQSEIEERSVARIRVIRKDPHEGTLGYIEDPNGNEQEIRDQWGGGTFRLEGLSAVGRIVVARTIKLAGDPIFVSPVAEAQWRRSRGLNTPAPTSGDKGMSVQDMMMMWKEQDNERRRAEDERRAREAAERREHEERMRKLELEAEERRRAEERDREERRRRLDVEQAEQRRRDEQERDERRRKDAEQSEQRQNMFMTNMLTMVKQSAAQSLEFAKATSTTQPQGGQLMDAIKTVVAIKEAFAGEEKPEEDGDPLSMLIKHGPSWLQGLGSTVGQAIRDVKGLPAAPIAPALSAAESSGLTIPASSPLAPKIQTLIEKIAAKGQNPEVVLSHVVDNMIRTVDGNPPAVATTADAPSIRPTVVPVPVAVAMATGETAPSAAQQPATAPIPAEPKAPPTPRAKVSSEKTARGSTRLTFS